MRGDELNTKKKLPQGHEEAHKNNYAAIIQQFAQIPQELKDRKQWLLWKLEQLSGRDKPTKVPYQVNGKKAKTTDPRTWWSYENVVEAWKHGGYSGIGFVFSSDDPYTGIDFDGCVDDGWDLTSPEVELLIDTLDSYTELSQSATGLHTIVKGKLPDNSRKRKDGFEIYDRERFFVVTGQHWGGTPLTVEDRQSQIEGIVKRLFPQDEGKGVRSGSATTLDDVRIIELATKAKNGSTFGKLFLSGDIHGDHSRSDLALCNILAFYTQDPEQIDRLFQQSALYREKWDRQDYKDRTIGEALAGLREVYKGRSETAAARLRLVQEDFADEDFGMPEAPDFRKSDLGNAQRLVHYYGKDLHYCFPFDKWFVYDGSRWTMDDTGNVLTMAEQVSRLIDDEIGMEPSDDKRKELRKQAQLAESTRGVKGMIELAKAGKNIPIMPNDIDADLWKINVGNGVIDLKRGKLLPHDRKYLMTKISNVNYDPEAECPRWLAFLDEILQDEQGNVRNDVIRFLQKAIGYSLTGDTSEQVLFFLHGSGKNGKSVFLNTIQALFADYAAQTGTDTFMVKPNQSGANNDVARLKGARLITASESEEGKRLAESLIKQLTGGEAITARFLHREFFEFVPAFKIFFATNHKPRIRGTDLAIWRRIRLIPFTVTIPDEKQDRQLAVKLREELPGILRWAVQGCLLWQREGLKPPAAVMAATDEYKEEMDTISEFIEDKLMLDKRSQVTNAELMRVYTFWCEANNEYALSKNVLLQKLTEYLSARGHPITKTRIGHGGPRGLQGIGVQYEYAKTFEE